MALSSASYSTAEVCRMLGIHRHTLRHWARELSVKPKRKYVRVKMLVLSWPAGLIPAILSSAKTEHIRERMLESLRASGVLRAGNPKRD